MSLRTRIFTGVLVLLALAVASAAIALSHNSSCPEGAPPAPDAQLMRAIVHRCYGPPEVLKLEQVAKPAIEDDSVRIKVHAAAVNPFEWHGMRGSPYIIRLSSGVGAPKDSLFGADFAGTVDAVGKNVTRFKPGDEVFGASGGALAEYVSSREQGSLVMKPANLTFEQAASIPIAAITALQAVRDHGRVRAGQKILINGASGGVGTFAVQIAKALGGEVTAVCSTRNVELVRSIGADRVVDYTREDFTEAATRYDVIVDTIGNHSVLALRRVLVPGGSMVLVGGPKGDWIGPMTGWIQSYVLQPFVDERLQRLLAHMNPDDLNVLATMAAEGKLRPVIDRTYPLSETATAIDYLEQGRARGKVVITVP